MELYVEAVIKDWKGFKVKYLTQLVPVELSGQSEDDELPYTAENALTMMKQSSDFDSWVASIVADLGKFPSSSKKS